MRKVLSKGFIIVAGVLTASTLTNSAHRLPLPLGSASRSQGQGAKDPRLERLTDFFQAMDSPLSDLADEFVSAADRYHLDWRLLPSISVVESGGGKRCKGNNIFGWDSGQKIFASVGAAIQTVADRLANSRLYRNKDLPSVLETYNGSAEYAHLVQSVMERVAPEEATVQKPACTSLQQAHPEIKASKH